MALDATTGSADDDLVLLRRFEPILRFTAGEFFLPVAVEDYVRCCELLEHGPDRQPIVVIPKGTLTIERLTEFGADHPLPGHHLRFVDSPFTRLEVAKWRVRGDRPRFHNASRLARVGVFSRGLDALNRASLIFRGRNASGTEAAAETQYRTLMRPDHHPYYGRVVRDSGYTVVQYWYFYAYNDWRSRVFGVNDHEADWEQITIHLTGPDGDLRPSWIASSAHDEVGDDLRRRWDDPDLTLDGDHPVIFPGLGSHSGAYLAGEYLTTHDVPAFAGLLRLTRRISRILLPWTADAEQSGLSIPYIDYSRGDGEAIGPGQGRAWSPVVIDETTPWVVHFRGLWGNDTRDPLGGERGPAGPRYERSAAVRSSWGDPVGWAGLRKVPPTTADAVEAVHARLAELATDVERVDVQVAQRQSIQRAAVAAGEGVSAGDESELAALSAERVALRDQQMLLADRLARPPAAANPHDHLRHRRMPLPAETKGRRRVLAIWSAVSTSVALGALVVFMLAPGWDVGAIALETVIVLFALEALARKQLWRFVLLVIAAVVVAALVLALSSALIADWRLVAAALLGLAATALLFLNVRELLRD